MALATPQLDVYFPGDLPPFHRLLVAVVAEHLLLAAHLSLRLATLPHQPDPLADEMRRKYLRGIHAQSRRETIETAGPSLGWCYPTSGPTRGGTPVCLHGNHFSRAVCNGEISLLLTLPRSPPTSPPLRLHAAFASERKLSCVLPPSPHAGVATLRLAIPEGRGEERGEGCSFRYYGAFRLLRLKPSSGPLHGGTAVRMLGSGFSQTGEVTVLLRMHGVERRVQAFWHSEAE
ncbi:MAG: hypothetical protein SGPRY_009596, partial [Prymnesium sp.]